MLPIPRKEMGSSYQDGNRWAIDYPTGRITQGAGIVKDGKNKQDHERI